LDEWQTAEGAKRGFYRVVALENSAHSGQANRRRSTATVTALHAAIPSRKECVDLAAAQVLDNSLDLVLLYSKNLIRGGGAKRAILVLPQVSCLIRIISLSLLPSHHLQKKELIANLENQRLDLSDVLKAEAISNALRIRELDIVVKLQGRLLFR